MDSANVVGFQNLYVTNGWSFFTVTFKNVGSATTDYVYDLTDIKVLRQDGTEWPSDLFSGACVNNLKVQKVAANGAYGTAYVYDSTQPVGKGWKVFGGTSIDKGVVKLAKGEGLVVYFDHKDLFTSIPTPRCMLQVSGEVELADTSCLLCQGWSFSGNNTPLKVDLTDIRVLRQDGTEWPSDLFSGACVNNLKVQKVAANGAYGTAYVYDSTQPVGKGWKVFGGTSIDKGVVTFEPGEGFVAYFDHKDLFTSVPTPYCKIVLPNPISK